jgi:hypothetical protein
VIKSLCALFLGWVALGAAAQLAPDASAQGNPRSFDQREPVLLELFTSQGCSSCPPADRLAAKLADDPRLVVVSRPVTYWDRLGWKDTLAREANTDLQRAYARQDLAGRNGVYTPQIVTDGAFGAVGSQERIIRDHLLKAQRSQTAAIRTRALSQGGFAVGLGGETRHKAELVLLAISSHETVQIGRGENRGRAIHYTNVVLDEIVIDQWNGGKASFKIDAAQLQTAGADRYALVLRQIGAGPVLAARWLS